MTRHNRVTAARKEGDYAALVIDAPDGRTVERGRRAIGADGAASKTRRSLGIGFEGLTYPELCLTIPTPCGFRDSLPDLTLADYVSDPGEWLVPPRVPDAWRVLFPARRDESRDQILAPGNVQRRLQNAARRDAPYTLKHETLYHVHQRVAALRENGELPAA